MTVHNRSGVEHVPAPMVQNNRTYFSATYKLAGRYYRYPPRNSRCKVCNSDYLPYIENNLVKAYGYTMIWNSLPDAEREQISVRNITDHAKAHLPDTDLLIQHASVRARQEEIGQDIEASTQAVIDHISFNRLVMQDVFRRWQDGDIAPEFKDGMMAAQFLAKVEEAAGGDIDRDVMVDTMMTYLDVLRANCTPEQLHTIRLALDSNPVFQALAARSDHRVIEGEQ